jgi:hypothetical protein
MQLIYPEESASPFFYYRSNDLIAVNHTHKFSTTSSARTELTDPAYPPRGYWKLNSRRRPVMRCWRFGGFK